jgi:hypothetical protein
MRDEETGVMLSPWAAGIVSEPGPPAGAEGKVSDLIRSMLMMKAGADGSGIAPETHEVLSRFSTAVSHPRDESRPIGRVRRVVLTTYEFGRLDVRVIGEVRSSEVLGEVGPAGDVRIILWEPRIAAGCYDCLIWSGSFVPVYFGEAVPVHVIAPAPAAPSLPPRPRSPAPTGSVEVTYERAIIVVV